MSLCVYQAHQHLMLSAHSCHFVFIKHLISFPSCHFVCIKHLMISFHRCHFVIIKLISIWWYPSTLVTLCLSSSSAFDIKLISIWSLSIVVTLCLSNSSAIDAIFPQLSLCLSSSSAFDAICPQLSLCVWRRRWPAEVWSSWRALSNDWVPSTQREAAHWAMLLLWGAEQEHSEWAHRDLRLPAVCAQPSQHIPRKLPLGEWKQHMLHLYTDRNGMESGNSTCFTCTLTETEWRVETAHASLVHWQKQTDLHCTSIKFWILNGVGCIPVNPYSLPVLGEDGHIGK